MSGSKPHAACRRGHAYTPENTYIQPKSGFRECRTCRAAKTKVRFWPKPVDPRADEHRFFSHVTEQNGCWLFRIKRGPLGYGQFWVGGRGVAAHRWAYELLVGPIPAGLHLDHLCRNPPCVNPWHLDPVTARVNTLRGETLPARNALKTECIHGHPFDAENTRINRDGSRACRACERASDQRRKARAAQAREVWLVGREAS